MHQGQVPVQEVQDLQEEGFLDGRTCNRYMDTPACWNKPMTERLRSEVCIHPFGVAHPLHCMARLFLFTSLDPLPFICPSCVAPVLFIDQLGSVA